jgi:hypothetical protein
MSASISSIERLLRRQRRESESNNSASDKASSFGNNVMRTIAYAALSKTTHTSLHIPKYVIHAYRIIYMVHWVVRVSHFV